MNKRLTKSDYVFSLIFIFMLVCAIGAFFFGIQIGTDRMNAKYEKMLHAKAEEAKGLPAYDQSYLVSFYHTVYEPFDEFRAKWFERLGEVENGGTADPSAVLKELTKLADGKYAEMERQSMPVTSPLLQQGLDNYLKSLKLFAKAANDLQSKANGRQSADLLSEIDKHAFFTQAKTFALQAQLNYYDSIVKWTQANQAEVPGLELLSSAELSLDDWNKLPLSLKSDYISGVLLAKHYFVPFAPQDLVIRIDELYKKKTVTASTVQQAVDVLIGTGAVRTGDFKSGKSKWYASEKLPQLPFFVG